MSRRKSSRAAARPAAILAAVALLMAAAGPAHGQIAGIGDQSREALSDPLFTPLGIQTARIVLPWDVAVSDLPRLVAWADAAAARGIEPLIAFGARAGDRCPSAPCHLPSDAEYRAAFRTLRANYPELQLFTPWNEPNHARQPTAGDPAMAAHYADVIAQECPQCTVVAGDVLDGPGMTAYLDFYKAALTTKPAVWSLHNYYDTSYFRSTGTTAFLAAVDGPVWLTETGGIVTWRAVDGQVQMPYDENRAAASLKFALDLAAAHADRITRVYVYQWRAGPAEDFDAGLLRPDGSPRPGLAVLRTALGLRSSSAVLAGGLVAGGRDDGLLPGVLTAGARPTAHATLGRVRLKRGRLLEANVRCLGAGVCRGVFTLEGSGRTAERLVNGRTMPGTLRPQRRRVSVVAGDGRAILIRIPRRVVGRAQRGVLVLKESLAPDTATGFVPARRVVRVRVPRRP